MPRVNDGCHFGQPQFEFASGNASVCINP
jgi:hypothetical protein